LTVNSNGVAICRRLLNDEAWLLGFIVNCGVISCFPTDGNLARVYIFFDQFIDSSGYNTSFLNWIIVNGPNFFVKIDYIPRIAKTGNLGGDGSSPRVRN
jgi:hypothetical protein